MRFNFAMGRDAEVARGVKCRYKGVVAALTDRIAEGRYAALPRTFSFLDRGRRLEWQLSGNVAAPCPVCYCDRVTYRPAGDGAPFDFCASCWIARGVEPAGDVTFEVCRTFEKELHDLPPGWKMSLPTEDGRIPLSPPLPEMTPEERRAAFERFIEEARAPLQIGRQWFLGRMAAEGLPPMATDYAEAHRWLGMAAAWGHGQALWLLGFLALRGLGEPKDFEKAAGLCLQAATRGDARAEASMGRLLWDGTGVTRDRAAAVGWWRRAVEKRNEEAELWLGQVLIEGIDVERDVEGGLALIRKAAEGRNAEAQECLGDLLVAGRQASADPAEGRKWLWRAAAQGRATAKAKIARMTEGDGG